MALSAIASGVVYGVAALAAGAAAYVFWPTSANDAGCPAVGTLAALLDEVRAGAIAKEEALKIAASYDGLGCVDAANAVRLATTTAAVRTPPTRRPGLGGGPGGFATVTVDPFGFDQLAQGEGADWMLPGAVRALLEKPSPDWTNDDRARLGPALLLRILADFERQGRYRPGVTPLARVTVYQDLRERLRIADIVAGIGSDTLAPGTVDFGTGTATEGWL